MEPVTIQTDKGQVDVKVSDRFSLNWHDVVKGLIIAAASPVVPIIQQSLTKGEFVFDWRAMLGAAVGGLLIYLSKNFLSKTATVTDTKEA